MAHPIRTVDDVRDALAPLVAALAEVEQWALEPGFALGLVDSRGTGLNESAETKHLASFLVALVGVTTECTNGREDDALAELRARLRAEAWLRMDAAEGTTRHPHAHIYLDSLVISRASRSSLRAFSSLAAARTLAAFLALSDAAITALWKDDDDSMDRFCGRVKRAAEHYVSARES